jgi:hypothetical protein
MKGACVSLAKRLAISVLPQPVGPATQGIADKCEHKQSFISFNAYKTKSLGSQVLEHEKTS